jgi:hypothetical protein
MKHLLLKPVLTPLLTLSLLVLCPLTASADGQAAKHSVTTSAKAQASKTYDANAVYNSVQQRCIGLGGRLFVFFEYRLKRCDVGFFTFSFF